MWLDAEGIVHFRPEPDYSGPASFSYTISDGRGGSAQALATLTIAPVNDAPEAFGEHLEGVEDTALLIAPGALLANDRDIDNAPSELRISAVGDAQGGVVALLPDGTLAFTPAPDHFGAAAFRYLVDDGTGGQTWATATLALAARNDAPRVTDETIALDEDHAATIDAQALLANDRDVDNPHQDLRIVSVDNARHCSVVLDADGAIRLVPEADYFGPAGFTYTVSDGVGGFTVGSAHLEIAPVNDAPRLSGERLALDEDQVARIATAALLANDSDIDNAQTDLTLTGVAEAVGGTVQLQDGEIVFTPQLNFNGQASFGYTVSDGAGGLAQARVELDIRAVNDAPVVNDELLWGKHDVTYSFSAAALLANDTDVETPGALRIVAVQAAEHGAVSLQADGRVSFVPTAGFSGRGAFEYLVEDAEGGRSSGRAEIDFSNANITPRATDDSFIGYEDVAFQIAAASCFSTTATRTTRTRACASAPWARPSTAR